jgi:hypothetical protein
MKIKKIRGKLFCKASVNTVLEYEDKKRYNVNYSKQLWKIGLKHLNLNVQQEAVKTTQVYTTGQKCLKPHHKKLG